MLYDHPRPVHLIDMSPKARYQHARHIIRYNKRFHNKVSYQRALSALFHSFEMYYAHTKWEGRFCFRWIWLVYTLEGGHRGLLGEVRYYGKSELIEPSDRRRVEYAISHYLAYDAGLIDAKIRIIS